MARELYQSLLTQVASEHFYFWLNSLKEFSHAEQCLTGLQEENYSSALSCIAESLKFYHKGIASLTVSPLHSPLVIRPVQKFSPFSFFGLSYFDHLDWALSADIKVINSHEYESKSLVLPFTTPLVFYDMWRWLQNLCRKSKCREIGFCLPTS